MVAISNTEPRSSYLYYSTTITTTIIPHMDLTPIYELSAPKGDFLEPPPPSTPITTSGYQLHLGLVAMVWDQSFTGLESESPYSHLGEFEQLCSCLIITGMPGKTLRWLLFPFSLTGEAKSWYHRAVGAEEGSWRHSKSSSVYTSSHFIESLISDAKS